MASATSPDSLQHCASQTRYNQNTIDDNETTNLLSTHKDIIMFTTMGMFIIDEIHYGKMSEKPPVYDIIGGAGTYSVLGCRLFFPGKHRTQCGLNRQSDQHNLCGVTEENHQSTLDSKPHFASGSSKQIGWIIDVGYDFPDSVKKEIEAWETGVVWRNTPDRQTTRGWNYYGPNEERDFKYLTPKIRIEVQDFQKYPQLMHSKSFHLICTPNRCLDICTKISRELKAESQSDLFETPVLIWEPVPGAISPTAFSECLTALNHVDIFSPNAKEAADFFGLPEPESKQQIRKVALQFLVHMVHKRIIDVDGANTSKEQPVNGISKASSQLASLGCSSHSSLASLEKDRSLSSYQQVGGCGQNGLSSSPYPRAVVVRCGAKGCAVYSQTKFPTSVQQTETVIPVFFDVTASSNEKKPTTLRFYEAWFPAYHGDPSDAGYKVEDPTGGGNTFLGGFAAGYLNDNRGRGKIGNLAKAAIYGNIAAGLAIEQVGFPQLERDTESWNGSSVEQRLDQYLAKHGFNHEILH